MTYKYGTAAMQHVTILTHISITILYITNICVDNLIVIRGVCYYIHIIIIVGICRLSTGDASHASTFHKWILQTAVIKMKCSIH